MQKIAAVVVIALALGACSGKATYPATVPTAPLGPPHQIQQFDAQATLALGAGVEGTTTIAILLTNIQALWDGKGWYTQPKCKDGIETNVAPLDPEQFVATVNVYYDAACTKKFVLTSAKATLFPTGNLSFTGTSTTYDTSEKPVLFATLDNTSTLTDTMVHGVTTGSIALSPSGPSIGSFGLTCDLGTIGSCGFGAIVEDAAQHASFGAAAELTGIVPNGSSTGPALLDAFRGAPGKLHLRQGSGTSWIVDGGAPVVSMAGTFSETVNQASYAVKGTLSLTDRRNATTASEAFSIKNGVSNGRIGAEGTTYATYSTDPVGIGTVDYSDRTTGNIFLFIVTS